MPSGGEWTVARLMDVATGYWPAAALSAAVHLGIFDAIAVGDGSAQDIASRIGAPEDYATDLLESLAAIGLLNRTGEVYTFDSGAARWIDPRSPACMIDALRMNLDLYPLWGRLAETIRGGQPAIDPTAHLGGDAGRTRRFVMAMHGRAMGMAAAMMPFLDPDPDAATLLDVGSGPGTFSRLLAETRPRLRVTQFDLPAVVAIAQELAAASPAADRIRYAAGDYRTDDLGGPYDAILYCGALHQENEATAQLVFQRLRSALRPGGRLRVVDLMREPGRASPAFACLFSLSMRLTSPIGRVFDAGDVCRLLVSAGFAEPVVRPVEDIPYICVSAVRP